MEQDDSLVPEPVLGDGVVRLRRWESSDLACVQEVSDEGVVPESTSVPVSYTEDAGRAWVERQRSRTVRGQGWSFAVTDATDGAAVGCVVLLLRPQSGVAGVGYWLAPSARGRGLASRAVDLVTAWGLSEVGLARVEAWVEPGNQDSIGVLARCGFEPEGRLRSFLTFPGRRSDALVYSRIGGP